MVAGMNQLKPSLDAADVALVAVGMGTAAQAEAFLKHTKFDGELWVDPNPKEFGSYKLLKLKHGQDVLRSQQGDKGIRSEVLEAAAAAGAAGFENEDKEKWGDIKQAGGAFVLGPGNSCDFVHRSAYAGDHPDLRELLAAATGKLPDGQDFTYPSASYWGARLDVNARAGSAATAQLEPGSNPPKPSNGGTASDRGAGAGERGAARLYRHAWPPWSLQLINLSGTAAMIAAASFTIAVVKFFFLNDAFKALCFLFLSAATWLLDPWAPPDVRNTFLDFVVSAITTSAAATSEGSTSSAETKNDLVLYTPKDIDAMAVSSGVIECDCSFIATTDVTSVIAEAAAAARAASVEGRSTSAQSDDGGDSDGYMTEAVARTRTFSVSRSAEAPPSPSDPSGAGLGREPAPAAIVPTVNAEDIREYQEAICYFREFLAKGHADLGRRGPICPFVPKALKQDLLYLSVVRTGGNPTSVEQVEDAAKQFLVRYSQLEPTQGRLQVYKAVLLIFPDVSLARASECIDQVQATLKPEFVRQGLMIGEFHKNNNASGLRNPEFFPLRTPTPCLAIRRIVATDLAFLDLSKYAVDVREEFLECYLKQFDPSAAGGAPHPVRLSNADRIAVENARTALAHLRGESAT